MPWAHRSRVAGLSLVSAHTEVRILSGNAVHHYSWFPAWLGVPLAAALFGWILVLLRRAGPAATAAIERRAVLLIAAPVALFVLVARLPGDLGQIGLFEQGQLVTETMLLGHGWLPWRDVVLAHGLLGDVAPTAVGWGVFGNSYWGAYAGGSLIFVSHSRSWRPIRLLAYLVGRSWPLLLIAALIFVGTWLGTADPRFLLWPLDPAAPRSAAEAPHASARGRPRLPGRRPGDRHSRDGAGGADRGCCLGCVRVVLAAARRAVGAGLSADDLARDRHRRLRGCLRDLHGEPGRPGRRRLRDLQSRRRPLARRCDSAQRRRVRSPEARFDFIALAPVAALLVSFAYAAVRLRLRRPFLLADWPMAAAALFVLFYYSKFLARMDLPHAYEPFMMATPLMIYIVYRAVSAVERWIRSRLPKRQAGWCRPIRSASRS